MLPILFTAGTFPISSFGISVILSLFLAIFFVWKLGIYLEANIEKVLDLSFFTLLGGFLGARIYHILFNLGEFNSLQRIFLLNTYPGLSFWGGLLGGSLFLWFFSKKMRLNYYLVADLALVGLFLGISIVSLGCFLGGCQSGLASNLPFAVPQVGLIGKRFPIQLFQAAIFALLFWSLYRKNYKFHQPGSIAFKGLMILGLLKLFFEFFTASTQRLFLNFTAGQVFSLLCIILGISIYYKIYKKSLLKDLKFVLSLFYNTSRRNQVLTRFKRACYNEFVNASMSIKNFPKRASKGLNIKSNPTKFHKL